MQAVHAWAISRLPDHAPGAGKQDDFEQDDRRLRGGAVLIVAKARIRYPQIDFVIEPVRQGVFKSAGEQLDGQITGKELHAGVDGFVAGHCAFHSN